MARRMTNVDVFEEVKLLPLPDVRYVYGLVGM